MIHLFGPADPPVPRLLGALGERGHVVRAAGSAATGEAVTLVLGAGADLDAMALDMLLGAWRKAPGGRVLVVSALGAHPDARAVRLRRLWELEERVRGHALAALTLRLAPLVGPGSPLWLRLRSRPRLPRRGRQLLNPVAEGDVIEALDRALRGRARWEGWFEISGGETVTLTELAVLARQAGPPLPRGAGAWEPPLAELEEQRLSEAEPWLAHFGMSTRPLGEQAAAWAA